MLRVRDAATDCALPAMVLRLTQTFGTEWDAAILWLYEKNNITVFILTKNTKNTLEGEFPPSFTGMNSLVLE